jgi:hypothetical protein
MSRMIDWIRKGAAIEELRRGPLTRDRAAGLRIRLLARAGVYGHGGGDGAGAAAAPTEDELEDEIFRLAGQRMEERQEPLAVCVDVILTSILSELAAGARL